jgi:transcription elongation factor Elf1
MYLMMPELSAIDVFPKEWANKVRCPICRSRVVEFHRSDIQPDKVHCSNCGVSFQIEKKGNHIKFLETPINFYEEMKNRWVTRNEVEEALQKISFHKPDKSPAMTAIPVNAKSNPTRAEAVRRARSLVQLKNSENAIRAALESSAKLSANEIDEIIKDAFNVYAAQQKQRNKRILIISLSIIIFLIVFFIVLNAVL